METGAFGLCVCFGFSHDAIMKKFDKVIARFTVSYSRDKPLQRLAGKPF